MSKKVISFHYTLTNSAGEVLDSSEGREPLSFLEGVGQIIPNLEAELRQLKVGDKKRVAIKADDAFGHKDPNNIVEVPLERMPTPDINVGDRFRAGEGPGAPIVTATKITETHVTLDGNHPLAGMDLMFDVEVTGVRDATEEEIAHGHAHGPGGHSH
jgi:FKBP-type peptidyl-prolyl cis-trans isomerase SlyD